MSIGRRAFLLAGAGLLGGCDRLSDSASFTAMLRQAQFLSRWAQNHVTGAGALAQEFGEDEVSGEFRSNGTSMPDSAIYRGLVANGFHDWLLQVDGAVRQPLQLNLAQLKMLPPRTQVTRHDCVEGWSVIGKWTGVQLARVLNLAGPLPRARFVVFHCADPMDGSDQTAPLSTYYESIDLAEAYHPQTILAYGLNDAPLPVANGAPLRLRVERQLGYKQAKYLMRIELVDRLDGIRGGKGGYWEDLGYEWYAGI
ncbi:molybdopterin-binding protein [Massilia terrae]|uniref:Molybdopterin-binding protein n=1 Tax=Massilia terrae TaxID=1811224 RepID=A0ABT2D0A8_9BURK|nr:molybdopterin-binding protein [Massilia terrae]MCS0658793.1 molybdopterin-binding protein [Massilia terrae]